MILSGMKRAEKRGEVLVMGIMSETILLITIINYNNKFKFKYE